MTKVGRLTEKLELGGKANPVKEDGQCVAARRHSLPLQTRWDGCGWPPVHGGQPFRGCPAHEVSNPFHFKGSTGSAITGVYIEDVVLPAAPQHTAAWLCEDVEGRVANASATPWPPCDAFKIVA